MLPGKIYRIVHILLDIGELLLIVIDDLFRLGTADTQVVRQPECPLAVDYSEIDAFRLIAHLLGHFLFLYTEYFGGRRGMNILSFTESSAHIGVTTDRGYNTQFDLGIIRRQKDEVFIPWNKSLPDLPSPFR